MIKVKNLTKAFGDNVVLRNISEEIHQNEVVCVIGPSGSGKSTFLRCLNRLETPTEGEIYLDDILIDENNINEVRTKMGMVFQNFNLFPHKTVLENITLAPVKVKKESADEAEKTAVKLLTKVGLADKKDSYPDELSGTGGYERTGGRRHDDGHRNSRDGICQRSRKQSILYGSGLHHGAGHAGADFRKPSERKDEKLFEQGALIG